MEVVARLDGAGKALIRSLEDAARKQLPFATAVALTRTAREAMDGVRDHLSSGKIFKVRNRGLVKRWGHVKARKSDWPNPVATVGTKDAFWLDHELGAVRRPRGNTITVPTKMVARRRGRTGAVPKAWRPRQVLASKGAWATPQQIRRKRKGLNVQVFYTRHKRVKIDRVKVFVPTVHGVARNRFPHHFGLELQAALQSMRVRKGSFGEEHARLRYLNARNGLGV